MQISIFTGSAKDGLINRKYRMIIMLDLISMITSLHGRLLTITMLAEKNRAGPYPRARR
jgi:hypothetical protein